MDFEKFRENFYHLLEDGGDAGLLVLLRGRSNDAEYIDDVIASGDQFFGSIREDVVVYFYSNFDSHETNHWWWDTLSGFRDPENHYLFGDADDASEYWVEEILNYKKPEAVNTEVFENLLDF